MHLIQVLLSDEEDEELEGGVGDQVGVGVGVRGVERASSITDCASIIDNTISSLSYDEYSDYESLSLQQQQQLQQISSSCGAAQNSEGLTYPDVDDSGYHQIEEKGTFYCSNHYGKQKVAGCDICMIKDKQGLKRACKSEKRINTVVLT